MNADRHAMIYELIEKKDIETQEELCNLLKENGFNVTQATVSRDIKKLKLIKVSGGKGKQKYAVIKNPAIHAEKYIMILKESFVSIDNAQNLLVIKTAPGMAMPVAAALDHLSIEGFMGSIAGDDTVMCAMKTVDNAVAAVNQIKAMIK